MPLRGELLHKSGWSKLVYFEEVKKIDGIWTVTRARVENRKKHSHMTATLKEVSYHPDLQDRWFKEQYLEETSSFPLPGHD
jgi:Outer membrane lipoprotein-sorting protein